MPTPIQLRRRSLDRIRYLRKQIEAKENELEELEAGFCREYPRGPRYILFTESEVSHMVPNRPRDRRRFIVARAAKFSITVQAAYAWLQRNSVIWTTRQREHPALANKGAAA